MKGFGDGVGAVDGCLEFGQGGGGDEGEGVRGGGGGV